MARTKRPPKLVAIDAARFSRCDGGPMCYADQQGLYNVVEAMKKFAANPRDDAGFSQPTTLLRRLAAECKSFA